MANVFILFSVGFLIATAFVHSVVGEHKLLKPLLAMRQGILANNLARMVLRFAWHVTSISWLVLILILMGFVIYPNHILQCSLFVTGLAFLAMGMFGAIASHGRFIGWPFLTGVGICALVALSLTP